MSRNQTKQGFNLIRAIRKVFVSSFVIFTFVIYALHERMAGPQSANLVNPPTAKASQGQQLAGPTQPAITVAPPTLPAPQATAPQPTTPPTAAPQVAGQYKDGQYTGSMENAFWGTVQVEAVVQNGKLANVQVLQYPSDRRTSVRINQFAIPVLQQEAVQAQNANIDLVSGATLTSQAFAQSLQNALSAASS